MMNQLAMLRLFNLVSPALPVGSFAYSQGLEWAIEEGGINTPERISDWLQGVLRHSLCHTDVAVMKRLYQCIEAKDREGCHYWNHWSLGSRETQELLDEDRHVASALMKVLRHHGLQEHPLQNDESAPGLMYTWSVAAVLWQIDLQSAAAGFCWSWLENQIAAAGKTLPLGQTDAQRIISALLPDVEQAVAQGLALEDADMGFSLPGWIMACAKHETQYSRLFRS